MSRIMPPVSTAGSGFLDSSTSLSQPTSCSPPLFFPFFLCYAAPTLSSFVSSPGERDASQPLKTVLAELTATGSILTLKVLSYH